MTTFIFYIRGINSKTHCRYAVLDGEIGQAVSCKIYTQYHRHAVSLYAPENMEENDT